MPSLTAPFVAFATLKSVYSVGVLRLVSSAMALAGRIAIALIAPKERAHRVRAAPDRALGRLIIVIFVSIELTILIYINHFRMELTFLAECLYSYV